MQNLCQIMDPQNDLKNGEVLRYVEIKGKHTCFTKDLQEDVNVSQMILMPK